MAVTKTDNIILNGPTDWTKWDNEFKSRAMSKRLWDYIKPDDPKALLEEPEIPDPATFAPPPAQSTRSQMATPEGGPSTATHDQSRAFQVAWNVYL